MAKLKIGIIGCGGIANGKHMPALAQHTDLCEITAFCDIIKERAEKAAKDFGTADAKVYVNYKELLADKSIDVVHVLTPNVSHSEISVNALEAGKHVMCEKPMAATSSDAQKMMDAWKKSGKQFTIGYQNRLRPDVTALKKACVAGELGDIYFAKGHAIRRRAVPTWGVFTNKEMQGGGPLIDIGTHALDLTLWMMDNYKPKSVTGSVFYKLGSLPHGPEGNMMGPWDPTTFEVEDSAFGMIKMENGANIILESAWAINLLESREACTTLCGTLAGAEIKSAGFGQYDLTFNRAHNGVLTEEKISPGGSIPYASRGGDAVGANEAKQWLEAIINDGTPLVQPQQAFVVTQILEAIYESSATGKEVYF